MIQYRAAGTTTSQGYVFFSSPDFTCERSAPFARGWRRSECLGGGERRKPRVANVTCRVRNAIENRHRGYVQYYLILYRTGEKRTTTTTHIYFCFASILLYSQKICLKKAFKCDEERYNSIEIQYRTVAVVYIKYHSGGGVNVFGIDQKRLRRRRQRANKILIIKTKKLRTVGRAIFIHQDRNFTYTQSNTTSIKRQRKIKIINQLCFYFLFGENIRFYSNYGSYGGLLLETLIITKRAQRHLN